jgi:hypothetical protein
LEKPSVTSRANARRHSRGITAADLPTATPQACTGTTNHLLTFVFPSPHHVFVARSWCRNINLLAIDYAFRPRLRIRLTLGGFTFPRKPWVFGEQDSHLFYRYSYRHSRFHVVQPFLRSTFNLMWNAPLPLTNGNADRQSAASVGNLVPLIFGADLLDQ